jgi:hypothetical protein
MMEGVNSIMIYCKNFCKCLNVPPVQQYDNYKKRKKEKKNLGLDDPPKYLELQIHPTAFISFWGRRAQGGEEEGERDTDRDRELCIILLFINSRFKYLCQHFNLFD